MIGILLLLSLHGPRCENGACLKHRPLIGVERRQERRDDRQERGRIVLPPRNK